MSLGYQRALALLRLPKGEGKEGGRSMESLAQTAERSNDSRRRSGRVPEPHRHRNKYRRGLCRALIY